MLGEDLVLVLGQQDRLMRGGDTWRHPVSYDKLAVRYRRWRNSLSRVFAAGSQKTSWLLARLDCLSAARAHFLPVPLICLQPLGWLSL